ncbi:6-phosphogluconolactonase [Lucifera butyrica]|nr:6-phosphogluconolactonase [Lucifera butyrica]
MTIQVFSTVTDVSNAAASMVADQAKTAIARHGSFHLVLSGGTTPRHTLERLAEPPYATGIPWNKVHIFWGDERWVPPDDSRSNQHMARTALLDHVAVPAGQIFPIPYRQSPEEAAEGYESTLRRLFGKQPPRFDLLFLGLGTDGHVASLFPGTDAVMEQRRWVCHTQTQGPAADRITLTFPVINRARTIIFLATGEEKAPKVREILAAAGVPPRLPAQLVHPVNGEIYWLLDQAAASLLTEKI